MFNLNFLSVPSMTASLPYNIVYQTSGNSPSTWYYIQCDCAKNNHGLPIYGCTTCNGSGYKAMSAEAYKAMTEKEEKQQWNFCPHCGEKL